MAFPETPRVVFKSNPLAEVICQIRFSTILDIATAPPAGFQDLIRHDYPEYARDNQMQVPPGFQEFMGKLPIGQGGQLIPEAVHHRFQTEDGNRLMTLAPDFVAIAEKKYVRWEHFRQEIERAVSALAEVYQPPYFTRLGLRYQDVISRKDLELENTDWADLLESPVAGLLGTDPAIRQSVSSVSSDTLIELEEGLGTVRLQNGLVEKDGEQVYLIDLDLFTERHTKGDEAIAILEQFHSQAGHLFRWAISGKLYDALGPTELDG